MSIKKLIFILLIPFLTIFAQDSLQTFLSLSRTGVEEFVNTHPEYDGRGTIIIVLDTGVDLGIDGLKYTSTGNVKVIDVQDFSHEGDIKLYESDIDEENDTLYFVNEDKGYKVAGADKLNLKSADDKYYIGAFDESRLKNSNSHAADLNGNGKSNDKYYVVAFQVKDGNDTYWVAYFDTNDNGDLSDEKPLRNYKEKFDSFQIPNEKGLSKLTFALNIFPDEMKISLHFDDGAHGTHVSGIAAGYHIGGTYLNGVAPGANIISLKIGNNNFSGGATVTESMKNAFIYADKISKEKKEACIINMSFGIGSEIEAQSDMELFLDSLLSKNPYLYVCVANGNEGPGISSTGLPAASDYILSSGAVLPQEVGRDLFGSSLNKDVVFFFSSRGGEVAKPDVCSPGASTSTVPNWNRRDVMGGTSMASPYTAGVVALLMSAMEKEYPDLKISSELVYRAIRNGATKLEDATPLDEGFGYINVTNSYKLLKKYIDEGEVKKLETYTVSSFAPNMPNDKSQCLYIRNGKYLNGNSTYTFNIKRNNFQDVDQFYRIYNIKSGSDWLIPVQKKSYLRNNQDANVNVRFDMKKLSEPGLYVGRISAFRDDKTAMPEFSMLATVVIPYEFDASNNFTQTWNNQTVENGGVNRYFIDVNSPQSSVVVEMNSIPKKYALARFRLFDPDGVITYGSSLLNSQRGNKNVSHTFYNLKPGIYELDVEGFFLGQETSNYNMTAQVMGIIRLDDKKLSTDNNKINIMNVSDEEGSYSLSGKILGYEKDWEAKLNSKENYTYPFVLKKGEASKEFTVTLSKENFNKVTDFSIIIYDKDGKAVEKDGLSYREGVLTISNDSDKDSTSYELTLIPAFSSAPDEMSVNIKEKTFVSNPQTISIKINNRSTANLYPSMENTLTLGFSKPDFAIPENSTVFGKIYFESTATKNIDQEMPILFNF